MSTWSYQAPPELSDEQYARWQSLLEERTGICFLQHKSILQKGLSQRMREVGVEDYEQYFQQVSAIPQGVVEWVQLVDRIAIKETSFFRDSHSFDCVRNYLLALFEQCHGTGISTLDIWSVGCSTGEETYTLAMIANEVIDYLMEKVFLGVLGTDISQTALAKARLGCYSYRKIEALPLALKNKYFVKNSENEYQLKPEFRERLSFVQGNILELNKVPKMAMDIIYCQNVLIYFHRDRQRQVLNALVEHLKPGGLLVLGPGEVIGWQHPLMRRNGDETVQAYLKNDLLESASRTTKVGLL
jgi:chemotaxis protein methyltransferase CheR/type IV pilus assembly protein PilK